MKKVFQTMTAAAALCAALATTATAQDAEKWQGFYTGLSLNAQDYNATGIGLPLDETYNIGIFGGYNHAIAPNVVIGGELSYGTETSAEILPGVDMTFENNLGIRGRAGYTFGNSMLYGTLGYATSDYRFNASPSGTADGVTFGAGLETMVSDNVTARFEYTRSQLEASGGVFPGQSFDQNTFSVGVAYKF